MLSLGSLRSKHQILGTLGKAMEGCCGGLLADLARIVSDLDRHGRDHRHLAHDFEADG